MWTFTTINRGYNEDILSSLQMAYIVRALFFRHQRGVRGGNYCGNPIARIFVLAIGFAGKFVPIWDSYREDKITHYRVCTRNYPVQILEPKFGAKLEPYRVCAGSYPTQILAPKFGANLSNFKTLRFNRNDTVLEIDII